MVLSLQGGEEISQSTGNGVQENQTKRRRDGGGRTQVTPIVHVLRKCCIPDACSGHEELNLNTHSALQKLPGSYAAVVSRCNGCNVLQLWRRGSLYPNPDQIRYHPTNPSSHLRPSGSPRHKVVKPVAEGPDSAFLTRQNRKANPRPTVCGDELRQWKAWYEPLLLVQC